jgi:hypothetical protein
MSVSLSWLSEMKWLAGCYFLGSSMASTIHAQPLWGMGFLSAFLTIWIFMVVSF